MNLENIKTEQDAIDWVGYNIPIAVKPTRKSSTTYVAPFTSQNALNVVVTSLGVKLFEEINKAFEEINKASKEINTSIDKLTDALTAETDMMHIQV